MQHAGSTVVIMALIAFALYRRAADGIGLLGGLILSYYAVKHLQFEKRDNGWYYRTKLWVEVTVLALLIGRIIRPNRGYKSKPPSTRRGAFCYVH